jgi:16S rRNA (guanine(966)-N(2))-methyltransferase RsmD
VRVIGGAFRSRRLKANPPPGIRPTSDKLRETLFNILGPRIVDAVFLDGCAGTGGVGIEAISRGAQMVYFADRSPKATAIIRDNLKELGVAGGFRVMDADLGKALDTCAAAGISFDVAFVDPPYEREDLYQAALERFASQPLLAADGVLVIEHSKRARLPEMEGPLRRYRELVQGDSALAFYRKDTD